MSKELIVSVTPQETKASILENDQVVEIHIERNQEHSLVGSIFRGRVTKVLPGMQSAFVDIGLERDSFLYVSDFFEDTEEYDKIVTTAEDQVAKFELGGKEPATPVTDIPTEGTIPSANALKYQDRRGRSRRSRRNRLRSKRFDEPAVISGEGAVVPREVIKPSAPQAEEQSVEESEYPAILPGESLAKYQHLTVPEPVSESGAGHAEFPTLLDVVGVDESETEDNEQAAEERESLELAGNDSEEEEEEESPEIEDRTLVPVPGAPEKELPTLAEPSEHKAFEDLKEEVVNVTASSLPKEVLTGERELVLAAETGAAGPTVIADVVGKATQDSLQESQPAPATPVLDQAQLPKVEPAPLVVADLLIAAPAPSVEPAPAGPPSSSQVQFRNSPAPPRFFRKNLDRRRRPHPAPDDRKESNGPSNVPLIGDLLKEGQEILVQISKEPLGTKGARITSHIALPGRYLVYMPTVDHIGVSRKIDSDEERLRLKRIIQENRRSLPGGFIVRTAGAGKGEEEFKSDIRFLSALWAEIKSKSERKAAPALIHRDLNLIQRLMRDQLSSDFSALRVDNETEYASILEFVNRFQPSMVNRVRLYTKDTPIFEEFGVQTEIDRALKSKVWLKSGGYIVIDQVEALVAIDVNTGKYVGKSNKLEDTIVKTNMEAAKEIARQIRLRDLGGIIVCDFIDMEDRKNRQKVTQTLEEALRADKSPSKVLQFNDFGLVAITRKRVKQSLLKTLCEPCPHCAGAGMVKSPQTVCYEIQAEVKKMARTLEDNPEITIRVNPEVARTLKTEEASVINEIEALLKKEVLIKSDPLLDQEHFDIF